jgi:hypothetical protein
MQTLGIIAFGAVDLAVFSVVLTALIWAAVKDGQKQRSVEESVLAASAAAPSPAPRPARAATPKTYRYKLAVAH